MPKIKTLELVGNDPHAWGMQHGEEFRSDISELYKIRLELMLQKTDLATEANVLALAEHHLPILQKYDAALYDELCGIAKASQLTAAQIVVLNHYTDLRDLSSRHLQEITKNASMGDDGACSAVYAPPHGFSAAATGAILAQTWDMHGTAQPYALLMTVPGKNPSGGKGSTVLFSITGCLGMTGMTSWGLGLTINNLNSLDATFGVVWPALVRKALQAHTAAEAIATLESAPIGSGRHYIVADTTDAFALESSGPVSKRILSSTGAQRTKEIYFHTNHCLDPELAQSCSIPAGSTTKPRYDTLHRLLVDEGYQPRTVEEMFTLLRHVGVPQAANEPHNGATCGALAMDLAGRRVIACSGIPTQGKTIHVQL